MVFLPWFFWFFWFFSKKTRFFWFFSHRDCFCWYFISLYTTLSNYFSFRSHCRDTAITNQMTPLPVRVNEAKDIRRDKCAVGRAALAPRRRHVALNVTRCDHPHSSDSVAKSSVLGFQFYSAGRVPGPVPPPCCTRYCEFRSFPLPNSISLNFLAFPGTLQKNSM